MMPASQPKRQTESEADGKMKHQRRPDSKIEDPVAGRHHLSCRGLNIYSKRPQGAPSSRHAPYVIS
ncbi:hypothetical protein H6P81_006358 [Aristolochia fimbriata]|uniref:Uncharacterized protein n=1 Tax=Aristolochia fimbriata TaxID=158543 RepID=A0AAV7EY87_ARIFI|nr:hypothetical protein H6P81_006358 [Aristolochia fimbriata]